MTNFDFVAAGAWPDQPERNRDIAHRALTGTMLKDLAKEYGVCQSTVHRIIHKHIWKLYEKPLPICTVRRIYKGEYE
jgi:Mor family transcriptional regulator